MTTRVPAVSVTLAAGQNKTCTNTNNDNDVVPTVSITNSADPSTLPEPGGVFTYTLTIHNTSVEPVTITALTDTNALSPGCLALIGTWPMCSRAGLKKRCTRSCSTRASRR